MIDLRNAKINSAGAYVCIRGLYPFAIGKRASHGRIPVFRLGGHREDYESGWQCAAREVYEEANVQITPLVPRHTYLVDADHLEADLQEIRWQPEAGQEQVPHLVIATARKSGIFLSLMYLAQADQYPTPSSEIKGLLFLGIGDIHRLCETPTTLDQYLKSGGKAVLSGNFNTRLILEPFTQLRLLARILKLTPDPEPLWL